MLRANVANCRNKFQLCAERKINREIEAKSRGFGLEVHRQEPGKPGVLGRQVVSHKIALCIVANCRKCPSRTRRMTEMGE